MRLIGVILLLALSAPTVSEACDGRLVSEHIHGDPVCAPSDPKRIVTLDPWLSLGMLDELGAPIIGVPILGIQDKALRDKMKTAGVADLGHPLEPSLESVIALQPDLIIGYSYLHQQVYDKLSDVAPTLLLEQMDWKDQFLMLAGIANRMEAARAMMDAYQRRAASIRERVPEDLEVSVVRVAPFGFQVYLDGPDAYAPYRVLREAGVRRTDYETTTDATMLKRPDWEELLELNGGVLLYVVASGLDPSPDNDLASSTIENPIWRLLPAVASGRAHRIDRATWMGFHGMTSAHRVLDDIERHILADQ